MVNKVMRPCKNSKIAFFVHSFSGGGAEKVMVTLANRFASKGYEVTFVVARDEGPYKKNLDNSISKKVLCNSKIKMIRRIEFIFGAMVFLRTFSGSVLSTISTMNIIVSVCHPLSFSKSRLFLREADTLDRFEQKGIVNFLKINMMRFLYPRAIKIIANSQATKNDVVKWVGVDEDKIECIYNPLDVVKIKEMFYDKVDSEVYPFVISMCGRLVEKKRYSHALKALNLLIEEYDVNACLWILGVGPDRDRLEMEVSELGLSDNVVFWGFQENPYKFIRKSNVFLHTSEYEGFGYVFAEALACETPVVAYKAKGAVNEILKDGAYGVLVKDGCCHELATALHRAYREKPVYDYADAAERFELDGIFNKYKLVIIDAGI